MRRAQQADHRTRPTGFRPAVLALAAVLTLCAGCVLVVPARAAGSSVAASQPLVVLLHDHVARTWPDAHARRIESVSAWRPLTGAQTVLPVLGSALSRNGQSWVLVRLPGRPNGHKGWIPAQQTTRTSTAWHIVITLSARLVTVYHRGRAARRFRAVVGKPSTPTPRGRFFIEEPVALSSRDAGGPFALATSARSEVLQEFEGGPGQVALHGTANLSGAPGTAVSHGCVRLSTGAITWLAERIGSGVPLTITR
jgi:lipoprotein-anchoring transpeptidase ErfK/SrfK